MKKTLVTAPNYYALSLAAAKDHLNVDHTADDAYISTLIGVATMQRLRLSYFMQTRPMVQLQIYVQLLVLLQMRWLEQS